mmetsp:Transcript_2496/g.5956  ORF Transcript_2496/g.5956 Transcript_2496/m.5956 type:complete len:217 (-) Transcript_2496:562-1212(-)
MVRLQLFPAVVFLQCLLQFGVVHEPLLALDPLPKERTLHMPTTAAPGRRRTHRWHRGARHNGSWLPSNQLGILPFEPYHRNALREHTKWSCLPFRWQCSTEPGRQTFSLLVAFAAAVRLLYFGVALVANHQRPRARARRDQLCQEVKEGGTSLIATHANDAIEVTDHARKAHFSEDNHVQRWNLKLFGKKLRIEVPAPSRAAGHHCQDVRLRLGVV